LAKQPQKSSAPVSSEWGEFRKAQDVLAERYNIVAASQGVGGSGKTHFWLTAPEPIAYFLLDPGGLKGLLTRRDSPFADKDIRLIDYSGRLDWGRLERPERVKRAYDIVADFNAAWDVAIKKARTIIIDKEDKLWETIRYAADEVDSPTPKNFYELNLDYAALIAQAEANGLNLGMIRGMKEKWGKTGISRTTGKPSMGFTGEQVPRGQKEVTELVQINLDHRWEGDRGSFVTTILEKCRLGNAKELLGKEYEDLDFLTLAAELYPDAPEDVWS
jgi:hypothetical protein